MVGGRRDTEKREEGRWAGVKARELNTENECDKRKWLAVGEL